ncbi:MAG: hypothetical protein IKM61_06790 [Eubacteriaceae bacterium]|nr:hypothetical protein [Eubacteriaceae bacterium]
MRSGKRQSVYCRQMMKALCFLKKSFGKLRMNFRTVSCKDCGFAELPQRKRSRMRSLRILGNMAP